MKKITVMLIFLTCALISCAGKNAQNNGTAVTVVGTENNADPENASTDEYLYIGGLCYNYKLSKLDGITNFRVRLHPWDESCSNSLEGIELLRNLTKLDIMQPLIVGEEENAKPDISGIDFSPLKSLMSLKELELLGVQLNEIPDFSGLPSLERIDFYRCRITAFNGIEKIRQIRSLHIEFANDYQGGFTLLSGLTGLEHLSVMYNWEVYNRSKSSFNLSDLSGMARLKSLDIQLSDTIDLAGLRNLSKLERLTLWKKANVLNIQELSHLQMLQELDAPMRGASLNFLTPLTNLYKLYLDGNGQTIDIEPLKNLVNLELLVLRRFNIRNFQVLDALPKLESVYTYGSTFSPAENNKLKNVGVEYFPDPK